MAVIQKIRERYAKWAGGVIALALVGFVLQDAFSGNSNIGKLFGGDPNSMAKVNGKNIEDMDFQRTVKDYQNLIELLQNKGKPMSEEEQTSNSQQVMESLVMDGLMRRDAEKLGLVVSDAERNELIYGKMPHPLIQRFLTSIYQTEKFDPSMAKQFEKEAPKQLNTVQDPQQRAGIEKALEMWEGAKRITVSLYMQQKYSALVGAGVYTPKAVFDRNMLDSKTLAGVRFVKIPYTSVNDNEAAVKVTDADLTAYMEKHRSLFETDQPSRNIEYVVFDINPDAEDTSRVLGSLQSVKSAFATDTNSEAFVNRNATEERYTNAFLSKRQFQSVMADTIFRSPVGTVVGPYFEQGSYKLVKVVGTKQMPDSVRAQHILIATASQQNPQGLSDTIAHARADSLFAAIKGGANFDSLATKYSDDPGSKTKGGDLGYFSQGKMVPQFNDSVFNGSTGEIKRVRTEFGYHIIRITDQKAFAPALKLAVISKALSTGDASRQHMNGVANEFAGKNQTATAFDAAIKKAGYNKRVAELKPTDFGIQGLGAAREVLAWAWAAKEGEVSNVKPIGYDKLVVARLTGINKEGIRPITAALRTQLEPVVRNEKKAKYIMDKYKGASLEAIAQAAGQPMDMADSVSAASSNSAKLGYEPRVAGYIFNPAFAVNTVSPAIKGREGVFYLQLVHRDAAPAAPTTAAADPMMEQQRMMMDQQEKQSVTGAMLQTLRKKGSVEYHVTNMHR